MKVKMRNWSGVFKEVELQDALTPFVDAYECEGQIERASNDVLSL